MSLFNLFRGSESKKSRTPRPARLRLETLEGREVPAILSMTFSLTNQSYGSNIPTVTVRTDSGSDNLSVTDRGTSGAGNLTSNNAALNNLLRNLRVEKFAVIDAGGSNTFSYTATTGRTIREIEYTGGTGRDNFTANVNAGLAFGHSLLIDAIGDPSGGAGADTMQANISGTLSAFSRLDVGMSGMGGSDSVASRVRADIARQASLNIALNANDYGLGNSLSDQSNNHVTLNYQGRLDGNLTFALLGSAGPDYLAARIDSVAGSTGRVGNGTTRGAVLDGGAGDDGVDMALLGATAPVTGAELWVHGGDGNDVSYYAHLYPVVPKFGASVERALPYNF